MEIEKTQLEQIIAQAANPDRLEPDQIPELDLYIDQILMLFEDKLGDNRRHEKDKILTKSMVNNYSKERMIRPMRGKKYTREQILQILLICSLKNMLSIGDIKRLMTVLMEEGVQAQGLEEIFRNDRDNQQSLRQDVEVCILTMQSKWTPLSLSRCCSAWPASPTAAAAPPRRSSTVSLCRTNTGKIQNRQNRETPRPLLDAAFPYFLLHNMRKKLAF